MWLARRETPVGKSSGPAPVELTDPESPLKMITWLQTTINTTKEKVKIFTLILRCGRSGGGGRRLLEEVTRKLGA